MSKQEYKYSLSYSNDNKKYGDGQGIFYNVKADEMDEAISDLKAFVKKVDAEILTNPPKDLYSRENIDKANKLVNEPRKSQLTNK